MPSINQIAHQYSTVQRSDLLQPILDQICTFLSLYGVNTIKGTFAPGTIAEVYSTDAFPFDITYRSGVLGHRNLVGLSVTISNRTKRGVNDWSTLAITPQNLLNFLSGEFITDPYIGRIEEYSDA